MSETARIVFSVGCGLGIGVVFALLIRPSLKVLPSPEQPVGWHVVENGEVVTPVMDNYRMKCCDCGLVHRFRFRAVKVRQHHADGTWWYDELDPKHYRVELTAWREDAAPGVQAVYGTISERAEQGKDGGLWKGAEDGR